GPRSARSRHASPSRNGRDAGAAVAPGSQRLASARGLCHDHLFFWGTARRRRAAVVAGGGRAGVFLTRGMPPVLDSGNAARAIMPMASGRPALRQDGQVTGGDLLQEAAEELYSSDPDEFIERRGALAARARAAWVLNQLVRSAPGAASQLAELGAELRTAQRALEGPAIRELSLRRRQLIDALARQAFTVAGQHAPAAALRDEVTGTLGAALADPADC